MIRSGERRVKPAGHGGGRAGLVRALGLALAAALSLPAAGDGVLVESIRTWPAPDHTRLVFDLSAPVEHNVFRLSQPERVVIDLPAAHLGPAVRPTADERDNQIEQIRTATRQRTDLRVVLDLKRQVRTRSFLLKPNRKYGHRLVIDLESLSVTRRPQKPAVPAERATGPGARLRDVVIAIDPGHGGEDPGALGRHGTREKEVVLRIAERTVAALERRPGIHAFLVRKGDYYVGLRKRMTIARTHRADLFVSIHADAFRDGRVHGSSVYVLSRNGASSEAAKWLADRENAADLIGGVSLDDKDDLLASVLLDLSQTATLSASAEAGSRVLGELGRLGKLHKTRVQQAGFAVLKSPDIPSILIETGFISSPGEERRLRNPRHQEALAEAIARGVARYFARNAPAGTLLAARKHVITRGETLSHIAARYGVPLNALRQVNQLPSDRIRVGQILRIPRGSGS